MSQVGEHTRRGGGEDIRFLGQTVYRLLCRGLGLVSWEEGLLVEGLAG